MKYRDLWFLGIFWISKDFMGFLGIFGNLRDFFEIFFDLFTPDCIWLFLPKFLRSTTNNTKPPSLPWCLGSSSSYCVDVSSLSSCGDAERTQGWHNSTISSITPRRMTKTGKGVWKSYFCVTSEIRFSKDLWKKKIWGEPEILKVSARKLWIDVWFYANVFKKSYQGAGALSDFRIFLFYFFSIY